MEKERSDLTEKILQLTLQIIYLLTGEDYGPMKKETTDQVTSRRRSPSLTMEPPSPFLTPWRINEKKILEVTNKITELLTGEVPIRCQDVAVYLSTEERKCFEGHKDLYKSAMMEEEPPLRSPDRSRKRNAPKKCPRPFYSQDSAQEEQSSPQEAQHKEIMCNVLAETVEDITDIQIKEEELSPQISPDSSATNINSETLAFVSKERNYNTEDFQTEEPMSPNLHPDDPSYYPATQGEWYSENSPPDFHHEDPLETEMLQCSACGKYFTQKSELLSHQRSHTMEDLLSSSESGEYISNVQEEQVVHNNEAPFSCSECKKSFVRRCDFLRHKSIHAKVRPFSCTKCGKCFTQRGHLLSHERSHEVQRQFPCSKCGKCYTKKSSLKTHEKIHIGLKPYICSICGKCFTRKTLLTLHERVHTGEKPYSCGECGRCFSQRPHLVAHTRTHLGKTKYPPQDRNFFPYSQE